MSQRDIEAKGTSESSLVPARFEEVDFGPAFIASMIEFGIDFHRITAARHRPFPEGRVFLGYLRSDGRTECLRL